MHLHESLSSFWRSLLVPVNVLEQPDTSFNESKPLSKLRNRHGPLLGLRLGIFSLLKGSFLPKLKKKNIVEREVLIIGVLQLEDFSIFVPTN